MIKFIFSEAQFDGLPWLPHDDQVPRRRILVGGGNNSQSIAQGQRPQRDGQDPP